MSPKILDRTQKGPQTIAPDITFEWVSEGRMIVFRLGTVTRDALDAYAEHYIQVVQDSSNKRPFLAMVDTTSKNFSFTPTFRQKINEMEAAVSPDMPGRLALLMEDSVKSHIFKLVMRAFNMPQRHKLLERRSFFDEQEALAWLDAGLTGEQNPP